MQTTQQTPHRMNTKLLECIALLHKRVATFWRVPFPVECDSLHAEMPFNIMQATFCTKKCKMSVFYASPKSPFMLGAFLSFDLSTFLHFQFIISVSFCVNQCQHCHCKTCRICNCLMPTLHKTLCCISFQDLLCARKLLFQLVLLIHFCCHCAVFTSVKTGMHFNEQNVMWVLMTMVAKDFMVQNKFVMGSHHCSRSCTIFGHFQPIGMLVGGSNLVHLALFLFACHSTLKCC